VRNPVAIHTGEYEVLSNGRGRRPAVSYSDEERTVLYARPAEVPRGNTPRPRLEERTMFNVPALPKRAPSLDLEDEYVPRQRATRRAQAYARQEQEYFDERTMQAPIPREAIDSQGESAGVPPARRPIAPPRPAPNQAPEAWDLHPMTRAHRPLPPQFIADMEDVSEPEAAYEHEVSLARAPEYAPPRQAPAPRRPAPVAMERLAPRPAPPPLPVAPPPPPPPAAPPPPSVMPKATDTMAPMAINAAALARAERPSYPVIVASAPPRAHGFYLAASIGMVGAIFALGIAIGFISFGATRMTPTAAAATLAPVIHEATAPVVVKPADDLAAKAVATAKAAESAKAMEVAKAPEAPKPSEDAKPAPPAKAEIAKASEPAKADAPKAGESAKAADKAGDAKVAKADAVASKHAAHDDGRVASKHAPRPAAERAPRAAVAAADSAPAAAKPAAAKSAEDLDMANEADALAKAQLEASLR
jgi:hypothetical protein